MREDYLMIIANMPTDVYSTKELTPEDKLIAERIVSLCRKKGECWITNKALAKIYGITENTVTLHIKRLKDYGLINCKYDNNNHKTKRTIYLSTDTLDKQFVSNTSNNVEDTHQIKGHNNNYNYKDNNKVIEPSWLNQDIKAQEWDMNNPEDVKARQELEDILAEFRGDDNE